MARIFLPSFRTFLLFGAAVLAPALSAGPISPISPLTQWESAAGGNDHYYRVFFDANEIQWTDAYAHAQSRGGYLATIASLEENIFLTALTFTPNGYLESWIGLTDELTEGAFVWVNDEPLNYTNWAPGEPNDDQDFGGEDYAILSPPVNPEENKPGSWNDLPNNPRRVTTWIVEWDLQPVPEPATLWTLALAAGLLLWFRRP
jgi:hypothetical protein